MRFLTAQKFILRTLVLVMVLLASFIATKPALASTLSLSPSSGTVAIGDVLSVQVRLNTAGEGVNAVSVFLSYPADKLDVAWISYSGSAFSIQAESTWGGGTIKISRGSINPVSGSVRVATIGFKGKKLGSAAVSYIGGSAAPRATDSTDSLNLGGSSGGSYNITATSPKATPTPVSKDQLTINNVTIASVSSNSAVINWVTNREADSLLEYGLNQGEYILDISSETLITQHSLRIESPFLTAGSSYHFRVKSKDKAGNVAVGEDMTFQLKGYQARVKIINQNNQTLANLEVLLYSYPQKATTGDDGVAVFENTTLGKHLVVVKLGTADKTSEITVIDSQTPQNFEVKVDTSVSAQQILKNPADLLNYLSVLGTKLGLPAETPPLYLLAGLAAAILLFIIIFLIIRSRRSTIRYFDVPNSDKTV